MELNRFVVLANPRQHRFVIDADIFVMMKFGASVAHQITTFCSNFTNVKLVLGAGVQDLLLQVDFLCSLVEAKVDLGQDILFYGMEREEVITGLRSFLGWHDDYYKYLIDEGMVERRPHAQESIPRIAVLLEKLQVPVGTGT